MFAYKYYRDKHLKYTRCVDQGDRKFPCHLCNRSFEKRDRLRIHILHVHEKHRPHKVRTRSSLQRACVVQLTRGRSGRGAEGTAPRVGLRRAWIKTCRLATANLVDYLMTLRFQSPVFGVREEFLPVVQSQQTHACALRRATVQVRVLQQGKKSPFQTCPQVWSRLCVRPSL